MRDSSFCEKVNVSLSALISLADYKITDEEVMIIENKTNRRRRMPARKAPGFRMRSGISLVSGKKKRTRCGVRWR